MSTIIEPHEPFAFFQTDSLKSCPQVCDLHERFGTASAKIHEFLDPDGEVVQADEEFPRQKNVNKKTNFVCWKCPQKNNLKLRTNCYTQIVKIYITVSILSQYILN